MRHIRETSFMSALLVQGLPEGTAHAYTDTRTGLRYTWSGALRGWYCEGTGCVVRLDQLDEGFRPTTEKGKPRSGGAPLSPQQELTVG